MKLTIPRIFLLAFLTALILPAAACVTDDDLDPLTPIHFQPPPEPGDDPAPDVGLTPDAGPDSDVESAPEPEPPVDPPPEPEPHPEDAPIPGIAPSWVGGHSVENRPLIIEHYGQEGPVLFVLSAIHGSERLAMTYNERFRTELNAGYAERHGIQVIHMQATNPDGIAYYSRQNVNGIDLNRNFPASTFVAGGPGGDLPLSEPETVAIKGAIDASSLTAVLSVHCCVPIFDYDGPGEDLATAMSEAMEQPYRFPAGKLGASNGSLGSYVGLDLNLPIITVEFARAEIMPPLTQLAQMTRAFEAAGQWTTNNPEPTAIDFAAMPRESHWPYRSFFTGESAGAIPLRAETIGAPSNERYFLLAGFGGEHRLGAWIAEHIRRELLAIPDLTTGHWHLVTAVNPDGIASGSRRNQGDVDVKMAIATGDTSTSEAAAILDYLEGPPATIFLIENSPDTVDRIAIHGPRAADLHEHIAPRFQASPAPEDMVLAEALAHHGHTVIQIVVGTENAEAQTRANDLDPDLLSPFDFSAMVLAMTAL